MFFLKQKKIFRDAFFYINNYLSLKEIKKIKNYNIVTTLSLSAYLKKKNETSIPCLWRITEKENKVYNYDLPMLPSEFKTLNHLIVGEMPDVNDEDVINNGLFDYKKNRLGLTGIAKFNNNYYCGSWNSIIEIDANTFKQKKIITNKLIADTHGVFVYQNTIITILTGMDTIVFSNFEGKIIKYFRIYPDLKVKSDKSIEDIDWRFVSKKFRGASGYWHFNYVQMVNNKLFITSRNISSIIVLDTEKLKTEILSLNLSEPCLLHDGVYANKKFHFTSIDGKLVTAQNSDNFVVNNLKITRAFEANIKKIKNTKYSKTPNWCRGISVKNNIKFVTIDGRYDTGLSMGILGLKDENDVIFYKKISKKLFKFPDRIISLTGFDVHADI